MLRKTLVKGNGAMVVVAEECTEDSVMSKMLPSDFCDVEGTSRACQQKELEEGGLSFFTCVLLRGLLRHSGFQPLNPVIPSPATWKPPHSSCDMNCLGHHCWIL